MCHYDVIYCESCNAINLFPPDFCDKIKSGIICTKYGEPNQELSGMVKLCMTAVYERAYDVTNSELRLYDILKAKETWIDYNLCSCGVINDLLTNASPESYTTADCFNNDSTYSGDEIDFDHCLSMGDGEWDNNGR